MKRWIPITWFALITTGIGLGGYWWWQQNGNATTPANGNPATSSPLAIVVSGDTAGWIVPCGCTSNQSGGLLRRGAYLKQLKVDHEVLAIDVGGAANGTSAYELVKFEAILKGEQAMGVVAHNLGGPEAAFGADVLRDVAIKLHMPFVSANLRDTRGDLLAPSHIVVETGNRRVGIIGVVSQTFQKDGVRIDDPRDAVLRSLNEIRETCESVIVLAYLPEEELRELAAAVPEVDVIVGGPTGQNLSPIHVGPTLLASATNKGRFLLTLEPSDDTQTGTWTAEFNEMSADFGDDPVQQHNVDEFRAELARRDISAADSGFAMFASATVPDSFRIAGSQACAACHEQETDTWTSSAHHHAWETLSETNAQVDAYCQQCHTTGFGMPGGFLSARRSPDRFSVGCESCHGPSAGHATDPMVRTPFRAADQCRTCHDLENSPEFEYATYWDQIAHGDDVLDLKTKRPDFPAQTEEQP